jgi:hypothetical protein
LEPSDEPVVLLKLDSYSSNPAATRDQTNVAVWHDGRIAWRAADNSMHEGQIDPARIQALLSRLHEEGVFGDGTIKYSNLGPGASFDVIEIRSHDRELVLRSWHELYDDGVRWLATANGIEALEGRDPAAVIAAQPEQYKRFVRIWAEIKTTVESWIPSEDVPDR